MPATNIDFWVAKFEANVGRDLRNINTLSDIGWQVLVVWECEVNDAKNLAKMLERILAFEPKVRPRC